MDKREAKDIATEHGLPDMACGHTSQSNAPSERQISDATAEIYAAAQAIAARIPNWVANDEASNRDFLAAIETWLSIRE